jgi:hypothetical protein
VSPSVPRSPFPATVALVVRLVTAGRSNREIADHLAISSKTVEKTSLIRVPKARHLIAPRSAARDASLNRARFRCGRRKMCDVETPGAASPQAPAGR